MSVRARGTEVERVTWGLGKGETSQAGAGGLYAGTHLPSSTACLLYRGSQVRHANKMG